MCFYVFGCGSAKNLTGPHCWSFFIMRPLSVHTERFINNEIIEWLACLSRCQQVYTLYYTLQPARYEHQLCKY